MKANTLSAFARMGQTRKLKSYMRNGAATKVNVNNDIFSDVSFIFIVNIYSSKMFGTLYQTTQHHSPEVGSLK
jgi:hypothetical protein